MLVARGPPGSPPRAKKSIPVMLCQDLQLAKRLNPHNSGPKVDRYPGQGLCLELVGQPV